MNVRVDTKSSQNNSQRNSSTSKQSKDIRSTKIANELNSFESSLSDNFESKRSLRDQRTVSSRTSKTNPKVGKIGISHVDNRRSVASKPSVQNVKRFNRVDSQKVEKEKAIDIGLSCNFENKTNQSSTNGLLIAYDRSSQMSKKVAVLMRVYKTFPNKKINVSKTEKMAVKSKYHRNCLPVEINSLECRKSPNRKHITTPTSTINDEEKLVKDNFEKVPKNEESLLSVCTETSNEARSFSQLEGNSETKELESSLPEDNSVFEQITGDLLTFKLVTNKCQSANDLEHTMESSEMKNHLPEAIPTSTSFPNLKEMNFKTNMMKPMKEQSDDLQLEKTSESAENDKSGLDDKNSSEKEDFSSENVIQTDSFLPHSETNESKTSDSSPDNDPPSCLENSTCKHCPQDGQSAVTAGVLSAGEVVWVPIHGSITAEQRIDNEEFTGSKGWNKRRHALCNPTEMIVSQEFRERAEHNLSMRRTRVGKKISHFVKSTIFSNCEVDLI